MQARMASFMRSGACRSISNVNSSGPAARLVGCSPRRYSKSVAVMAPRSVSLASGGTRGMSPKRNGRRE